MCTVEKLHRFNCFDMQVYRGIQFITGAVQEQQ